MPRVELSTAEVWRGLSHLSSESSLLTLLLRSHWDSQKGRWGWPGMSVGPRAGPSYRRIWTIRDTMKGKDRYSWTPFGNEGYWEKPKSLLAGPDQNENECFEDDSVCKSGFYGHMGGSHAAGGPSVCTLASSRPLGPATSYPRNVHLRAGREEALPHPHRPCHTTVWLISKCSFWYHVCN